MRKDGSSYLQIRDGQMGVQKNVFSDAKSHSDTLALPIAESSSVGTPICRGDFLVPKKSDPLDRGVKPLLQIPAVQTAIKDRIYSWIKNLIFRKARLLATGKER